MLKQTPGWKLHKVPDVESALLSLPSAQATANNTTTTTTNNNTNDDHNNNNIFNEEVSEGHLFGLEHLLSAVSKSDEVCYRDSIEKRSRDSRSQVRHVLPLELRLTVTVSDCDYDYNSDCNC